MIADYGAKIIRYEIKPKAMDYNLLFRFHLNRVYQNHTETRAAICG